MVQIALRLMMEVIVSANCVTCLDFGFIQCGGCTGSWQSIRYEAIPCKPCHQSGTLVCRKCRGQGKLRVKAKKGTKYAPNVLRLKGGWIERQCTSCAIMVENPMFRFWRPPKLVPGTFAKYAGPPPRTIPKGIGQIKCKRCDGRGTYAQTRTCMTCKRGNRGRVPCPAATHK